MHWGMRKSENKQEAKVLLASLHNGLHSHLDQTDQCPGLTVAQHIFN